MDKLKWTFIIGFIIAQILDMLSTLKALKNPMAYETNPVMNWLMGLGFNYALVVILFMLVVTGFVIGAVLVFDWLNEDVGNHYIDFGLKCFYLVGILYLVIFRIIFIVIPNFGI